LYIFKTSPFPFSELKNELTHAPEHNTAVIAVFPSVPATEGDSDSLEESLETPCGIDSEAVVPETVAQEDLLKAASEIEVQQNSTNSDQINDKTSELENELTHAPEQNTAVIAVFPSSPATKGDSDSLDESLETPCGIENEAIVSETVSKEELLKAASEVEVIAVFPSVPATEGDSDSLEEPLETPCDIDSEAVVPETVAQEELLKAASEIEVLQNSTNTDQINDK
uniref:Uncharacterized protein n=1 Tax=Anopheles atroparvus TaxID=41427 RepID=A0AAG5CZ62_ANOAO